ncbi:MAG TPA: GMC oxidoreductase [Bryobacteraceae bacterium]|jgi:choline dehydrogenase-like flavoprotein
MRDVIVIGAGGGGAVIAKELAARGLDVLVLEAGARFPDPQRDWTHFEVDANSPLSGFFRFGPSNRSQPAWRRELPQNSVLQQVAGVGGTTLHYFGNSPRANPGVFVDYDGADREAYDTAHLFPLSYRELIPYYEWVEYTLPVQTAPMGTKEEIFFRGAHKMGLPLQTTKDTAGAAYRPQENAILQPGGSAGRTSDPAALRYPQATGCTLCGHCLQGCYQPLGSPRNLRAKRSTDNSYIPMAVTADRWSRGKPVTLLSDAFVCGVAADPNSETRRVDWRSTITGAQASEEARVVVMAGGTVETPRLWLNCDLPNPNDQVGRGFTDHFSDALGGIAPFYTGTSKGAGSNARVDFPGHGAIEQFCGTPAFTASSGLLSDGGIAGYYDNGLPRSPQGADVVGRVVGKELKDLMRDLDRILIVVVLTDDDVEAQNRVTPSATLSDEHGPVPRVEIHQRQRSARTIANREFLAGKAAELLRAAGSTKVYRFNFPPTMIHVHSTMRMGLRPEDSVLDENCEARWAKRIFVADNSGLANAVGGCNPTLTTQALATRTAERIFQLYFGGDPWVCRESPVASTDSRITEAVALAAGVSGD